MKDLFLRRGGDRRLRGGHLWIYSNEIDSERSPCRCSSQFVTSAGLTKSSKSLARLAMQQERIRQLVPTMRVRCGFRAGMNGNLLDPSTIREK